MATVNNYHGFVIMQRAIEETSPEMSHVVGKPRVQWHTLEPMVIYPTFQQLVEAVPGFNKKTHFVGEVIVHLLAERVETVSIGDK